MKHFVCTGGCQGVAPSPGTCQAKDCPKHGLPLVECNCEDGQHQETMPALEQSSENKHQ